MKTKTFCITVLAALTLTSGLVSAAILSPPTPASPGSTSSPGALVTTSVFTWSPVAGATGYGLYLRDLTTSTNVFSSNGSVTSVSGYNLPAGYLEPGHAFRWYATTVNADGESVPSAYRYFQTGLPNLLPWQPAGWSDKIVVNNLNASPAGPQGDAATLTTLDPIYVYIAGANRGNADVLTDNYADIYLDGVYTQVRLTLPPANLTNYWAFQFPLGHLGAGTHSFRIVNDSTGIVTESNETDNEYTKTFTVTATGSEPQISSISPDPVPGSNSQQIVTVNGSRFVNKPTVTLSWTGQPNYTVPTDQITYVSDTQLQMAITTELTLDNWTVAVTNPDGQTSNRFGFQVVNNLPSSPTTLETQSFSDHVELGWTDNSTNETGFFIERSTGTGAFVQIGSTAGSTGNAAFYTDNTTSRRTTYTYRVRAYNANGYSGYTNEVTAATPGGLPGDFTLSNEAPVWDTSIPGPKVQLNWTASNDVGNYAVFRNGSVYQAGIAGTSYLNLANLTAGATYTYFIRASNADGTTDSNTVTVTMPIGPGTVPEIVVESPLNTNVAVAGSKSFGSVVVGANTSLTFTIKNTGTADLTGLSITKDGADAGMFTVTSYPSAPVSGPSGSTTFTVRFTPVSAGSKSAVIHIANNDSDENPFDITLSGSGYTPALPTAGLVITGPTACGTDSSVQFQAIATYGGSQPDEDVTSLATWSGSGAAFNYTGLERSVLAGNRLVTGLLVPIGEKVNITASYTGVSGRIRSAPHEVVIGAGDKLGVGIGLGGNNGRYLRPTGGENYVWQIDATTGGEARHASGVIWQWYLDDVLQSSNSGDFIQEYTGLPGSIRLKVVVTDGLGRTGTDTRLVSLQRPALNEPGQKFRASQPTGVKIQNGEGGLFDFDATRTSHGLIVLVHGMRSGPNEQWIKDLANAIDDNLQDASKPLPNIAIFGWEQGAKPHDIVQTDMNDLAKELKMDPSLLTDVPVVGPFLYDIKQIKGNSTAYSIKLAQWVKDEEALGHINFEKPIHFIGHSAGGFVVGGGAYWLKKWNTVNVTQVTMLDTPLPFAEDLTTLSPTKVERYISSFFGSCAPSIGELPLWDQAISLVNFTKIVHFTEPLPNGPYYKRITLSRFWPPPAGPLWPDPYWAHSYSHEWYQDTVVEPSSSEDGFAASPFMNTQAPAASPSSIQAFAMMNEGDALAPPPVALVGFSTFGSVSGSGSPYVFAEDTNAGIQQTMTLPIGADALQFRYQFTTAGDGDFIAVYFGDNPPLFIGPDVMAARTAPMDVNVPLKGYEGQTGALVIKLVSQGQTNAVAQIDEITLTTTDDPDHDALTTDQEQTLGTNPLVYDTDSDGIGDWEEVNTTLTNPLLADSDGDGMTDAQEIIAGTSGVDATSVFRTNGTIVAANGDVTITWAAKAGKTYRVQRSDAPDFANYTVEGDSIPGVEPTTSFTDSSVPGDTARMFYRVEVE